MEINDLILNLIFDISGINKESKKENEITQEETGSQQKFLDVITKPTELENQYKDFDIEGEINIERIDIKKNDIEEDGLRIKKNENKIEITNNEDMKEKESLKIVKIEVEPTIIYDNSQNKEIRTETDTEYKTEINEKNTTTVEKIKNIKDEKEIKLLTEIKNIFASGKEVNKKENNVELKITEIRIVRGKTEGEQTKNIDFKINDNNTNKEEVKLEFEETLGTEKKQNTNTNTENKTLKETLKNEISEITNGKVKINEQNKTIEAQVKTEDFGKVKIQTLMNQGVLKITVTVEKGMEQYNKLEISEIIEDVKKENKMEIEVEIKEEDERKEDKELEKEKKKKRNLATNGEFERVMEEGEKDDKH